MPDDAALTAIRTPSDGSLEYAKRRAGIAAAMLQDTKGVEPRNPRDILAQAQYITDLMNQLTEGLENANRWLGKFPRTP